MPSGEIRAADVADLAGLDQIVKGAESLLNGRRPVEGVELIEIDKIGTEPFQAPLDSRESDDNATIPTSLGPDRRETPTWWR